ncbi:glycosyltransferase family 2 protein [Halorhodospira halochloris]|uniref:glycosyltransferase family 2 protein n=1 Tax=Halorhodospira halochloris TaxID=1052 RepID=UPI001EE8D4AB|nr:glycosyltransferase family 2 protein [Halorhodospira halochloris]
MTVVAIIPAYNEATTITEVVKRALEYCSVVVVDDGSSDLTSQDVANVGAKVLRNESNRGKAFSLWRGFRYALESGAKFIITLDADGQHLPEDIPRLIAKAEHNPGSIVIGGRTRRLERMPKLRKFGNRAANFWISWASGQWIADTQSGFRVYPASVLREMIEQNATQGRGFVLESEILIEASWRGVPIVIEEVEAVYPPWARRSYYRPTADTLSIIMMVAGKLISRGLYPYGLVSIMKARR